MEFCFNKYGQKNCLTDKFCFSLIQNSENGKVLGFKLRSKYFGGEIPLHCFTGIVIQCP